MILALEKLTERFNMTDELFRPAGSTFAPTKIDAKVREEAAELGLALIGESDDRVASEAGDVIYHLLVGLVLRQVSLRDLLSQLSSRFGQSGHEEKGSR